MAMGPTWVACIAQNFKSIPVYLLAENGQKDYCVNVTARAGGGVDKDKYVACITSYDYDAPISEAGDYGQPGIGGPNRYQVGPALLRRA